MRPSAVYDLDVVLAAGRFEAGRRAIEANDDAKGTAHFDDALKATMLVQMRLDPCGRIGAFRITAVR